MNVPQCIVLICGKRKSGKDYLAIQLQNILGPNKCEIIHISKPIKEFWAREHNLNLEELLSDRVYKENHRKAMVEWSEEIRRKDFGYFCRLACQQSQIKDIWIISDIRRKTDIQYFQETYPLVNLKLINIHSSLKSREERGWKFTKGIDDQETECDLDDWTQWDFIINNDNENIDDFQNHLNNMSIDAKLDYISKRDFNYGSKHYYHNFPGFLNISYLQR